MKDTFLDIALVLFGIAMLVTMRQKSLLKFTIFVVILALARELIIRLYAQLWRNRCGWNLKFKRQNDGAAEFGWCNLNFAVTALCFYRRQRILPCFKNCRIYKSSLYRLTDFTRGEDLRLIPRFLLLVADFARANTTDFCGGSKNYKPNEQARA